MTLSRKQTPLSLALAGAAFLAFLTPAWGEEEEKAGSKNKTGQQEQQTQADDSANDEEAQNQEAEPRELKAFDLEHRKAQEIQQILSLRSRAMLPQAAAGATGQQRTAFRPQFDQQHQFSIATDQENNVLFVRGSEDDIQEVEELVKALDVSGDSLERQEIGGMQLIPISSESENRVRTTLSQLQLQHQIIRLEDAAIVVVSHDGTDAQKAASQQVQEVISKLGADKISSEKDAEDSEAENSAESQKKDGDESDQSSGNSSES